MKKQIAVLVLGLLLIGGSLYAADGDLIVNGKLGVGTTNLVSKITVSGGSANWNEAIPGLTPGSFHLNPGNATDHFGSAITFGASDYGNGENAQAGIYTRSDDTYGTKMYFSTTDAYVIGAKTRMMIDHAGNVGIGTTNPATKLEVSNQSGIFGGPATSGTNQPNASFRIKAWNAILDFGTFNDGRQWIQTGAASDLSLSYYPLLLNPNGGNVGIGTTSPTKKLEVMGG